MFETSNDEVPWKPSRQQLDNARDGRLRDVLQFGLKGVLCGINPSLYSAAVNRHFARPGNRFWPAIAAAGITERVYSPFEDHALPTCGYGLTNMAPRATARADELSSDELVRGRRSLARKLAKYRPNSLAILGITSYRAAFDVKGPVPLGPQDRVVAGVPVYVLPNPSGLNANYQLNDLAKLYRAYDRWASRIVDSGLEAGD